MAFDAAVRIARLQVIYIQTIGVIPNFFVQLASETFAPCPAEFIGVHEVRNYIDPFHGQIMRAFTLSKDNTIIDPVGNQCAPPKVDHALNIQASTTRACLEDSYSRKHLS
jgi:hypothetical protein